MRQRGLSPNVISFSAAISACEKCGQWQRVDPLVDEMRSRGLSPNVIIFSAAISACDNGGQRLHVVPLLDEMRGLGPVLRRGQLQRSHLSL
eukprot:11212780-Karenia_brevis.AAC.1